MATTVSVVIPTYNRKRYLPEALASIWAQTRPADEIIVVDDGSTDGTAAELQKLRRPMTYLRQENAGPSAARNRGLRAARSEWVAFLDSDDLWLPDKLRVQLDFLHDHPRVDFAFGTQVNLRDGVADAVPEILNAGVYRELQQARGDVRNFFTLLLRTNPIPTSSVIFRRTRLPAVGYFDERFWRCEDLDLWLRFALQATIGFIDQPLVAKRAQGDNLINDYVKLWSAHLEVVRALPARHPELGLPGDAGWRRAVAGTLYRLGSFELSHGRTAEANRWFAELRWHELPALSRDQALALIKKALLALHLGGLGRTVRRTA